MTIAKANGYFAVAAAALGLVLTAGKPAVAETMLDQYTVRDMGIAQVNDAGQCVVIVTVNSGDAGADEIRVVGDANGAAKLYASIGSAEGIIKSSKIELTTDFTIKRKLKAVTLGSPINELKAFHKAFVKEKASSTAASAKHETDRLVMVGLGYDVAGAGSPQLAEYENVILLKASVDEIKANATAKEAQYATLLTNAGINPLTYLPI
jgi:hypothetical protein